MKRCCALLVLGLGLSLSAKEPASNLDLVRQLNQAFVAVAEKMTPAVVVINVVEKPDEPDTSISPDSLPREFRRYLHPQSEEEQPEKALGQGSGVIIREDGYILTNGHVIENAEKIEVRLHDGRRFKATVRGTDQRSDVAVIKIEATNLPVAKLADSNQTKVGEFAIAFGTPFSLDYSVTYGHVSAKGRSNIIMGELGAGMDQDYIQTDANINPGNSGGPLVNIEGEVIGINTLIRGLHTGIGFAIPSSLAKEVSDKLIAEGKFSRAWLGIEIRAFRDDPDYRTLFKGVEDGVVVRRVLPDGPAAKSDLKATDVITAVDGKAVSTPQDLRGEIRGKKFGEPILLSVVRSGKPIEVKIKPAEWADPPTTVASLTQESLPEGEAPLGLSVHVLTRELAKRFAVKTTQGVVVLSVQKGSVAERQNIQPGEIVTAVNQKSVSNPTEFREAVDKADAKAGIILTLVSGKSSRFEILKP